jgi:hypothetical protein
MVVGNVAHPWVVQVLDPVVKFLESLAFIGVQSHVIKLDYVDSKIQPVADSLGMALPLIKVRPRSAGRQIQPVKSSTVELLALLLPPH